MKQLKQVENVVESVRIIELSWEILELNFVRVEIKILELLETFGKKLHFQITLLNDIFESNFWVRLKV